MIQLHKAPKNAKVVIKCSIINVKMDLDALILTKDGHYNIYLFITEKKTFKVLLYDYKYVHFVVFTMCHFLIRDL